MQFLLTVVMTDLNKRQAVIKIKENSLVFKM